MFPNGYFTKSYFSAFYFPPIDGVSASIHFLDFNHPLYAVRLASGAEAFLDISTTTITNLDVLYTLE